MREHFIIIEFKSLKLSDLRNNKTSKKHHILK